MNLLNKKILITGGAGFIGSHTADELLAKGAKVAIIDNFSTGRIENLNAKAVFYKMNINDVENIAKVLEIERPEIIYHFAFHVLVPQSTDDPLLDMPAIIGTIKMLKKAKELNCVKKIIFASSGFVYGNNPNIPIKETEPADYLSSYSITKNTIENYLKFYKQAFGIPYVILRYSAVYGPRQVTGAMQDYIRKLRNGEQATIWGDGNKTRDYVNIKDVVRANIMALDIDSKSPIFNISTGKETTLNKLYKMLARRLGKTAKPIYCSDRIGEQIRYSLDWSRARKEMGWSPTISLKEGLNEIC